MLHPSDALQRPKTMFIFFSVVDGRINDPAERNIVNTCKMREKFSYLSYGSPSREENVRN